LPAMWADGGGYGERGRVVGVGRAEKPRTSAHRPGVLPKLPYQITLPGPDARSRFARTVDRCRRQRAWLP
jgi:hypothetical protein